ncbi:MULTISPECIES: hypothetical protein [Anoxybacillaceae]|uniref:hypothetical protein n=1 Tax=Anoxybacillaceae TaxID=3120669 RepID=UPI0013161D38|nr:MULTISPECIES: hypothetical protein [Anoxybacillus]MBS2772266.1 hypothetical protein [Anoxybacillus rupiensis]QHC05255.1 hypothetical protein GRQ40_15845 [Anoxybacillus sp. PDR2]
MNDFIGQDTRIWGRPWGWGVRPWGFFGPRPFFGGGPFFGGFLGGLLGSALVPPFYGGYPYFGYPYYY